MPEVAVHVEAGNQRVVNALEQRCSPKNQVVSGGSPINLIDRSTVGVPIHGQRGVGVRACAVPKQIEWRDRAARTTPRSTALRLRFQKAIFEASSGNSRSSLMSRMVVFHHRLS